MVMCSDTHLPIFLFWLYRLRPNDVQNWKQKGSSTFFSMGTFFLLVMFSSVRSLCLKYVPHVPNQWSISRAPFYIQLLPSPPPPSSLSPSQPYSYSYLFVWNCYLIDCDSILIIRIQVLEHNSNNNQICCGINSHLSMIWSEVMRTKKKKNTQMEQTFRNYLHRKKSILRQRIHTHIRTQTRCKHTSKLVTLNGRNKSFRRKI